MPQPATRHLAAFYFLNVPSFVTCSENIPQKGPLVIKPRHHILRYTKDECRDHYYISNEWEINQYGGRVEEKSMSKVLDESRSFFRVHTGYFSNIPKCIKAEFIASWACSQSSVVSRSQR
ncbi:hypothetical protein TNCV_2411961 [Trichonephila clavipes]|nr:hypothetical protein TNCV_2411961 [Trichonephila clavipes]